MEAQESKREDGEEKKKRKKKDGEEITNWSTSFNNMLVEKLPLNGWMVCDGQWPITFGNRDSW